KRGPRLVSLSLTAGLPQIRGKGLTVGGLRASADLGLRATLTYHLIGLPKSDVGVRPGAKQMTIIARGKASTEPITDHGNGSRSRTKSARPLPQSRPQKQNAADDLPGERRQAAGGRYLVR